VFAGVRKNSDAAVGYLLEFSANLFDNAGSFGLAAPGGSLADFQFISKGSSFGAADYIVAARSTRVITVLGDIAGDTATIRQNGTQAGQSTADQGTGNYLAYPAYIYARGGTSLPFNGYDFGHAVRFGSNLDAATIARVEALIARNTPEVTL